LSSDFLPPEPTNANLPLPEEDATSVGPGASRWWAGLFRPLILAALMTCLIAPLVVLGEGFFPNWRGEYLLFVIPLVVLEGLWSQRLYQRLQISGTDLFGPWLAEGVLLILFAKLAGYIGRGPALLAEVRVWAKEPLFFLNSTTIPLIVLVVLVWHLSQMLQTTMDQLGDPGEVGADRQKAKETLQTFVVGGGVWLLFLGGVIIAFSRFYPAFHGSLSALMQGAVIFYFALALFLLGHSHYLQRRVEWAIGGIAIPPTIGRRWIRWGLLITLGVFFLAALLPAGQALGAGGLLASLVNSVFFISIIFYFLLSLLLSPIAFLLRLFSGGRVTSPPPQLSPELPQDALAGTPGWLLIVRLLLMWGFVAAVIALGLYIYFRDRNLPRTSLRRFFNWLTWVARSLWMWWRRVYARTSLTWNQIRAKLSPRLNERKPASAVSLLAARTPRARIRRYYLTLLKRAAEFGIERAPQQTPDEYAAKLKPHVPDHETDLNALTEAFIRARYSAAELNDLEVSPVRSAWQKLRDVLRRR
jgi:hypothetical protein